MAFSLVILVTIRFTWCASMTTSTRTAQISTKLTGASTILVISVRLSCSHCHSMSWHRFSMQHSCFVPHGRFSQQVVAHSSTNGSKPPMGRHCQLVIPYPPLYPVHVYVSLAMTLACLCDRTQSAPRHHETRMVLFLLLLLLAMLLRLLFRIEFRCRRFHRQHDVYQCCSKNF